ncbi:hypothetical protein CPT32_06590 [Rhizobium sophoriradicis]|nr:hypothetical protein CPT32_06590 [Rhizobium sophoriradicis]
MHVFFWSSLHTSIGYWRQYGNGGWEKFSSRGYAVRYPLCPAGHLPHKEGDRQEVGSSFPLYASAYLCGNCLSKPSRPSNLPTCRGGAR